MAVPLQENDPRQLGGYWLAARLGAGGQGVVFEGYDDRGNRAAVKALHGDAVNEVVRHGLRKELATLQRVASFCTARVIAADLDHTPPYIVSEYVDGPDLQGWVDRTGAYAPDDLHRLAIGIATAVSSIHRAGVIHRDLKPANVLLGPDGPRVIDFGIAKTEEMSRSATGMMKGTPRWMSPEAFRGQSATPAVDVWAWGAVVLFAATGKPPFDGDTLPTLMHQVLNHRPDTGVLAEPLRSLVEAALDRDPAERPSPEQILAGLIGGETRDPLQAGERAAAETTRPSMAMPPSLTALAEQAYGRLDPHAQEAVPRILLRMVATGPGAQDTLRRVDVGELADADTDQSTLQRVLRSFGEAGLIYGDGGAVGIGTPAFLRAWPRMRDWVESERDGLNSHHALADAARRWNANGRKPADLYQGSTLDEALDWASTGRRRLTLNPTERAFLDASVGQTRSRARLKTAVTAALTVLLLVATATGATAFVQSQNLRETNKTVARQRDAAVGRQVAAQAVQLRRSDPALARRLAVAAASLSGGPDVHNTLLTLWSQWEQGIYRPPSVDPGADNGWKVETPSGLGPYVWWKANTMVFADPGTRKVTRTVNVPGAPLKGSQLSLDGKKLLTLQEDQSLVLWDTATGARTPVSQRHPAGVGLGLSPSGTRLIVSGRGQVKIFDLASGRPLFGAKGQFRNLALSPDERTLVGARMNGKKRDTLVWWDLPTAKEVKLNIPYFATVVETYFDLAFSPDGRFFAARDKDRITIVDARTRAELTDMKLPPKHDGTDLAFSRDGEYLASGMALWQTRDGGFVPLMRYKPDDYCYNNQFSADGTSLRCVDTQERVRSIDIGAFVRPVKVAEQYSELTLSADGSTLAATQPNGLQIWNTANAAKRELLPIQLKKGSPGERMALSRDGAKLAHLRNEGLVDIWDVRARAKRATVNLGPLPANSLGRPQPSFSPDGKALATLTPAKTPDGTLTAPQSSPATLRFWDTSNGRQIGEARAKRRDPASDDTSSNLRIVWSQDGKRVVSANDLGVVEFPSGKTLAEPNALATTVQAISRQGTVVTVQDRVSQRSLNFWDVRNLKQIGNAVSAPGSKTPIAAFSPDGTLLATSDLKGNLDLWDVKNQRRFGLSLTGRTPGSIDAEVDSLAFSADGTRLYSVSGEDGKLVTHLVAPAPLKAALCKQVGGLTKQEWTQHIPDLTYRKTC
ncbi:protein kinase domain-containing protein [Spirillospora sp. CA-294931]|uniref:protein kinase domain-containing protein n=1 Tax=Spirillospora sp. CA-294931 TaxID=3240042 RepID=UPI003D8F459D